jgi:signal transduction histidine kinase/ligand-binding sensor domain-containing protein
LIQPVDIGLPAGPAESRQVNDLVEDLEGALWVATPAGLYRRGRDGVVTRYTVLDGLPSDFVHDLLLDRGGRLWAATRYGGFFRVRPPDRARASVVEEAHGERTGLGTPWVNALWHASDGRFWAATNRGVVAFVPGAGRDAARYETYTRRHGLSHQEVTTLGEDAGGNLWIGTAASGAMRISRRGFVTFGLQDGVVSINDLFEDATGTLFVRGSAVVQARGQEDFAGQFGRFTGRGFEWFSPAPPFSPGWNFEHVTVRARDGDWWVAGGEGLYRFPALASFERITSARPLRVYAVADGLAAPQVRRLFEDSRGDLWIATHGATFGLTRWNRASGTLQDMTRVAGLPPVDREWPHAIGEDAAGNVWIGLTSGVARHRDGAFVFFSAREGLPSGTVGSIHRDRAGRLWLGSAHGGLVRVDGHDDPAPRFASFTTAHGLSGDRIDAITEDLHGRIYVATGRGIDQLDPEAGRVRHFGAADGLAPGNVIKAYRDRHGTLWFGTHGGLSRFSPGPPEPVAPPVIQITGLRVAGHGRPVSALGEREVTLPDLTQAASQLRVEFVAFGFAPGERLRYQYRLDGAGGDWGPPTPERSISYASLSPGRYRLEARAINADGAVSPAPAVVRFVVLRPMWQRWWFLGLAALAAGAVGWALHRSRLLRVVELERVRTRIATDLHDDVGADLTRIAILSEVARRQFGAAEPAAEARLASIAGIARDSVAAMSDIVWAVSPGRDTLREVLRKMRDYAEGVLEGRDVELSLRLPDEAPDLTLGVDVRRDLYLIFKEALNNAVRHSRCGRVAIALRLDGGRLVLDVSDDGRGFAADAGSEGNGLGNMRRRARRHGAALDVRSAPGRGTAVRLVLPLARRARPGPARPER